MNKHIRSYAITKGRSNYETVITFDDGFKMHRKSPSYDAAFEVVQRVGVLLDKISADITKRKAESTSKTM